MKQTTVSVSLVILALAALATAAERHVINKISVPGDYGWDYLTADSEGRRLYVSHGKEVVVIDLDSDAIVGNLNYAHGKRSERRPGSVDVFES